MIAVKSSARFIGAWFFPAFALHVAAFVASVVSTCVLGVVERNIYGAFGWGIVALHEIKAMAAMVSDAK